jgi:hypothetical protein
MTERLTPPLALSPDAAQGLFYRDPETGERVADPIAAAVEAALRDGQRSCEALCELDRASRVDPSLTPSARALKVRQAAERVGKRVATDLDRARARLVAEAEAVEAATAAPPFNPSTAPFEVEIRAGLRGLGPNARQEAVGAALASGDLVTLGAVLRAPPLASGLAPDTLAMIRDRFRREYFPDELARLARLERGLKGIDQAVTAFAAFIGRAVGAGEDAEVAATRTAAAVAALDHGEPR